jgi:hypothetical protein
MLEDILRALGPYRFITPTPATHQRFLDRHARQARDLRDAFGWNLPFRPDLLPPGLLRCLKEHELLDAYPDGLVRSRIRISSLGALRFIHSAYPTDGPDAVFFGPDSYRFARFIEAQLPRAGQALHLVDMGAGSGVGGIVASTLIRAAKITLLDINPAALRLAAANAAAAGVSAECVVGRELVDVEGNIDLVIANPPFMIDDRGRAYRDGGAMQGARLSLDWALEAAERLTAGGTMLLYTGSAIVDGRDALRDALAAALPALGCTLAYQEIDPDIFGEALEEPGYADVERIAAVGAVIRKAH